MKIFYNKKYSHVKYALRTFVFTEVIFINDLYENHLSMFEYLPKTKLFYFVIIVYEIHNNKKLIVININNRYYINYLMTEVIPELIHFNLLNLPIPTIIMSYSIDKQREIFEYLSEMHEKERIGYKIALDHLGTSFDICRSNGFINWKRSKQ